MYDELVKALRCEYYGDDECDNSACPYWSELGCKNGVANREAADAIEKLIAERKQLVRCGRCEYYSNEMNCCSYVNGLQNVTKTDYCSYGRCADGERKDGEHDNQRM